MTIINAYVLVNAVERNRSHPRTFDIPTEAERRGLRVGDDAKLGFQWQKPSDGTDHWGGERMWVNVTGILGEREETRYVGALHNEPFEEIAPIRHGATVTFRPENICDIHRAGESWDAWAPPKKTRSQRPMKRIDARKKRATAC